eukprot:642519-Alexandrium_andersonii.AAC.1
MAARDRPCLVVVYVLNDVTYDANQVQWGWAPQRPPGVGRQHPQVGERGFRFSQAALLHRSRPGEALGPTL